MAKWNFEDFLRRLEAIKGMGFLEDLEERMPGLASLLKQVDFRLDELEPIERILKAMSLEERLDPDLLEGEAGQERRRRIATQSGTSLEDVNALIWQFRMLCQMLEDMSPEEVTRELIESGEPKAEEWQTSPDAWKEGAELPVVDPVGYEHDDDDVQTGVEVDPAVALELQVDEVLRKVARTGMTSLSPAERTILEEASRRYRARREQRQG